MSLEEVQREAAKPDGIIILLHEGKNHFTFDEDGKVIPFPFPEGWQP